MKTHKLTLCAFAAIAALATACSNDELASTDTPQKGVVIEAIATTPQGGADTRLTHTDGVSKMNIVWAAGDSFTAFNMSNGSDRTDYVLQGEAGKTSASFTGTWGTAPGENDEILAIYPAVKSEGFAFSLTLEGQDGTLAGLKDFNYMRAMSPSNPLSFEFEHMVAIVKLALTFPDGVTGDANNIGLTAAKGLYQSYQLDLIAGGGGYQPAGDLTTGTNSLPIGGDGKLTAYLCVFAKGQELKNVKAIAKVGNDDYEVDLSDLDIFYAGNMYTATVTMKKAADYIEVNGIEVAVGNLVADEANGAKIGAPTDNGLYFQFGSLVGWNPTGAPKIAVKPDGCSVTSWDQGWKGDPTTESTANGTGDPCKYYLKDTWRLPTKDEFKTLFKDTYSYYWGDDSGWSWNDSSATHTSGLTFPASGCRSNTKKGDLTQVGSYGYYWSVSYSDKDDKGYNLYFSGTAPKPSETSIPANGMSVRCVKD